MNRWLVRVFAPALGAVLLGLVVPAEAAAARSSGKARADSARASGRSAGPARTAARGRASRAPARAVARGTARYGYGSRAHRGGYYFPRYRYYGYGYWGYPHPYYWSGWYYHYPSYTYVYGDAAYGDAPAVFETDIRPKRAELWVDGEPRGQARDFNGKWDLLYLEPGAHTLEFRHPGHRTLKLDAHVRAGMYYRLDERLAEGEGTEERSLGRPVPGEEPAPSASGADYRVEPPADHRRPAPGLRAGLLRIHALPSDAAVYLDGEFLGHAEELARLHGAIPVAEGRHVVEVVRPGYEPQRQEIVVEGREPVRLDIELARRR